MSTAYRIFVIALKHLSGQHNQKRHGWRYSGLEGARRSMRRQDEGERMEYRKRAGMPGLETIQSTKKPYTSTAKKLSPKGIPVSSALKYPKKGESGAIATSVIGAIDSVHGDGNMAGNTLGGSIPIAFNNTTSRGGAYQYWSNGKAKITVSREAPKDYQAGALAHEIGHAIDYKSGMAGKNPEGIKKLFDTIKNSDAYKTLQDMKINPGKYEKKVAKYANEDISVSSKTIRPDYKMTKYFISEIELFARAYSQYIGVRSGNKSILDGVKSVGKGTPYERVAQWSDKDFEPIAKAMDGLFTDLGWMG